MKPSELSALAEKVVAQRDGPFFAGFGFVPDYTPASLVVLDSFFDLMWGVKGEAPSADNWTPPQGKQGMILQFGAYLGETLARLWNGQWKEDARGPMWSAVEFSQQLNCMPFGKVYRRLKNGREDSLFALYLAARDRLGPPPGERESYAAHAKRLRALAVPREALEAIADLDALAAGGLPKERAAPPPEFEEAREDLGSKQPFRGVSLDASAGSLIAIDGVLDELWGTPAEPRQIDQALVGELADPLIAYVGEVIVKHFGGRWTLDKAGAWSVALPGGTGINPLVFLKGRLTRGADFTLWRQLETARTLDAIVVRTGKLPQPPLALSDADAPPLDPAIWKAIADYGDASSKRGQSKIATRILNHLVGSREPAVRAQGHFKLSALASAEKRYGDVVTELDRALALQPDVPDWIEAKAAALVELKRNDEARPLLERLLAREPKRALSCRAMGILCARTGKPGDAAALLERALESRPNDAEAWLWLGLAHMNLGANEKAIASLGQALAKGIEQSDAIWLVRAQVERKVGRNDDALKSLTQIKSDVPQASALRAEIERDVAYLLDKANDHAHQGRTTDSITWYRRVVEVDPAHAEARRQLAIALAENGDNEAALAEFDTLVAAHPDNTTAQDNRATLLVRMKAYDKALPVFDAAIAKEPDASTFKRRGYCYACLGRKDEALADYVRSVEVDPTYVESWLFRAEMERDLGQADAARTSWRRALALRPGPTYQARTEIHRMLWELDHPGKKAQPEAAEPFRQQAFALAGEGRWPEVLQHLDRALELDPTDAESWQNRAATLVQIGQTAEAAEAMRKAVDYDAPPPRALGGLAMLLMELGRWKEALPVLDRLMEVDPRNPEYAQMKAHCQRQLA